MKWTDKNLMPQGKFLKLKQGENKLRIVSEVEVYGKHYSTAGGKAITCIGKDKGCMGCDAGNESKPQWSCYAIDRTDEKIRIWEFGYTIFQKIQKLAKSAEYGFENLPNYDITITKEGEGLDTEYDVIPSRKDIALTEEEKEAIAVLIPIADIIAKKKKITEEEPF